MRGSHRARTTAAALAVALATAAAPAAAQSAGAGARLSLLAVIYLGSLFGPPPPDERTIAVSALALWLLVPWGYWVDRHRAGMGVAVEESPRPTPAA